MAVVFKNNAKTTLASNLSSSATSIAVADGSVFPSLGSGEIFFCTLDDGTNNEIVKVTAISSNTLTVVRAQESTTARAFSTGDAADLRLTAGILGLFSQTGVAVTDEIEAYLDANGLTFPDNVKAQFGTNNDLQIYSTGSFSYIKELGTGGLYLDTNGDGIYLRGTTGNKNMVRAIKDGAVTLYHDGDIKLATTSTGIDVTGVITTDGLTTSADINFGDNDKAVFGAGSDLQIYHTSADNSSYIRELGAGNLKILGDNVQILNAAGTENQIFSASDGSVYLYHNGVAKFETTSTGVSVTGAITSTGMTVNSRTTYGSGGFFDNASNGNNVGIKTGGDHLFLTDGNGGVADGTKDIGISTRRVRNIHMSGTLTSGTISSGAITAPSLNSAGTVTINSTGAGATLTVNRVSGQPNIKAGTDDSGYLIMDSSGGNAALNWYTSNNVVLALGGGNVGVGMNSGLTDKLNVNGSVGIGGTTVIDASRNLTNIGTITASGAITSSGALSVNSGSANVAATFQSTDAIAGIKLQDSAGNVELSASGSTFQVQPSGGAAQLTVDASGNATFAGTISSGAITSSGNISLTGGVDRRIKLSDSGVAGVSTSDNTVYVRGNDDTLILNAAGNGLIKFQENGVERFRIDGSGNLQMGSSPTTVIDASRNIINANAIGIGTASVTSGYLLHLKSTGDAAILLEADTDNVTETDNPRIQFSQDGGIVQGRIGYTNGANTFEVINEYNDSLILGQNNQARLTINSTSATFAGTITGTTATASAGTNTTALANTAFVQQEITSLIGGAPGTLDTLNELAAAINDDSNYNSTLTTALATKLPSASYTAADVLTKIKTVDGASSGLDADLLDGIQGSSFLRSDANDTFTAATLSISGSGSTSELNLGTYGSTNQGVLYLNGSTTNKRSIIKTTNGNLHIDSASGNNTYLNFYNGSGTYFGGGAGNVVAVLGPDGDLWKGSGDNSGSKYWHAGNDGAGSGLDADTLDGLQLHTTQGSQNTANTILRTQNNGYAHLGWINTPSGVTTSTINKIYSSNDDYIRYVTPATFISQLGLFTTSNDGSGSGLDADLLDGNQASAFVVKSGDTMTGALKVGTKLYEDFNDTGHFYLGNNDWGSLINGSGNGYSATHKGMSFNNQSGTIPCVIPIDPEATYRVKIRFKQVTVSSGSGKFYFGVDTLNEDKSRLSSDQATSYNYGVVIGQGHSAGTVYTYEDTFSGYNATNAADHQKFDPEGKYFNLVWIANYQGSGEVVIQSIEVERLPGSIWVGDSKVIDESRNLTNVGTVDGVDIAARNSVLTSTTTTANAALPKAGGTMTGALNAGGGITGLTLSNGINGNNFNIAGVNQLSINDPGEGISFGGGSNTVNLFAIDDSSDNIMNFSGAAELRVNNSKVWTQANDGSGSGLDADTVDGVQLSGIARLNYDNTNEIRATNFKANAGGVYYAYTAAGNLRGYMYATDTNDEHLVLRTSGGEDIAFKDDTTNNMIVRGDGNVWIRGAIVNGTIPYSQVTGTPTIPTNNNQLTNGAGYVTSTGSITESHRVSGSVFATTGSPGSVLEYQQAASITDTKLAPSGNWHNTIRMGHGNPYSYYSNTLAMQMTGTGTGRIRTQTISNNTALGWREVWDSGNDGSGSSLDADLLDGQHGSYYAPASSSTAGVAHGYLSLGQLTSAMDTTNLDLDVVGNASIRAGSYLYFGISSSNYGSWKTRIGSANTSTMYIHSQGIDINNTGYANPAVNWLTANASTFSHKGNTIWHAGNDGSGSGLDADLLDGQHASSFLTGNQTITLSGHAVGSGTTSIPVTVEYVDSKLDANNVNLNNPPNLPASGSRGVVGFYNAYFPTGSGNISNYNAPLDSGQHYHIQQFNGYSTTDAAWSYQIAYNFYNQGMFHRNQYNGTWQAWRKSWDSLNDGSGSGLDADNLDGYAWTSQNKAVAARNLTIEAGNGQGIGFWGGTGTVGNGSYAIFMGTSGTYGRVPGETTSDYNMYFKMSSGTNRGFVFRNNTTNVAGFDASGHLSCGNVLIRDENALIFDRDSATGDPSTKIYADDYPDGGYNSSASKYWVALESKGGTHIILNSDGATNASENSFDHFSIFQDQATHAGRQFYVTNVGNVHAKGNITAFQSSNMSDVRLKKNIKPLKNSLEKIQQLEGVSFDWKDEDRGSSIGFIAQDFEKVVPELVQEQPCITDGTTIHKSINYGNLVGLLVEAIKEQQKQIDELKEKNDIIFKGE